MTTDLMETVSSVFVPPLQLTEGQPPPIAANGGLSYLSFDRDGDAGTAAATEAASAQIAEGGGQAFALGTSWPSRVKNRLLIEERTRVIETLLTVIVKFSTKLRQASIDAMAELDDKAPLH